MSEANANPILQTTQQVQFADQLTSNSAVIDYIRSKFFTTKKRKSHFDPHSHTFFANINIMVTSFAFLKNKRTTKRKKPTRKDCDIILRMSFCIFTTQNEKKIRHQDIHHKVASTIVMWNIDHCEKEATCSSSTDNYYLDRLFFGIESNDLAIVKYFSDYHLLYLCRIRRLFPSEWSSPEQEKQTAYQRACLLGHTEIVEHMLQVGIKVDQVFFPDGIKDTQRSAFMFACHSDSLSTMRALLQALSNNPVEHFKSRNRKSTCSASFAKQYLIPRNSLAEESFDSTTNRVESIFPIHFAITRNNLEMAKLIVTDSKGEVETRNAWQPIQHGGFTPLHLACLFNRSLDMIHLLLSLDETDTNPLLQTSKQGQFADQLTNDTAVIEYLRAKRFSIMDTKERERLKDMEEMRLGKPYQIFIKPLSGDTITLTVTNQTTVADLAAYFQREFGLPYQKFICSGKIIEMFGKEMQPQPLVYYGIKKDSVVNMIWSNPKCSS